MRTQKAIMSIIDRIEASGGLTDDMREDIRRLKDELDEREGILKKYGEEYDGEEDEYEWKEKPTPNYAAELSDLQGKYNTLVERYNARYFSGGDEHATDRKIDYGEKGKEDYQNDGEDVTVKDLFVNIP